MSSALSEEVADVGCEEDALEVHLEVEEGDDVQLGEVQRG